MRTLIVLAVFILMLCQLTPKFDLLKTVYHLDLLTNLQTQFALLSVFLILITGLWDKTLMLTLLIINSFIIVANFSGYIHIQAITDKKQSLVNKLDSNQVHVAQFTFDDDLNTHLPTIYQAISNEKDRKSTRLNSSH